MKKPVLQLLFAGSLSMLMVACSGGGSDEPFTLPEQPVAPPAVIKLNTPNYLGGSLVKQIKYSGAFKLVYQWRFSYTDGQLSDATSWVLKNRTTTYNDKDAARYGFTYTAQGIDVSSAGTAAPVTLNVQNGLLTSAHSGNTTYNYSFSQDGRLTSWEVVYQNTGFNAQSTKGAAGILTWDSNGNIVEIVYTPSMDAPTKRYTYTFTYSDMQNVNGLMPELSSRAMGCEGSEYLYYSGLLGKSTRTLPSHLKVVFSDTPDVSDNYSFRYHSSNGKDVTNCEYGELGEVVNIEYNY